MKRYIALLCTAVMILSVLSGCGPDKNTVVTVNGETVGIGEFECYMYFVKSTIIASGGEDTEEYWNTFEIEGKKAGDVVKETALKNVIEYTLLAQKAVEMGADNSEAVKAEQRKLYISQMFGGDEEAYIARIGELGFSDADFSEVIMNDYLAKEYYSREKFAPVTDAQVKDFYDKNYYRAHHILVALSNYVTDGSDGQTEARAKIEEVKSKLDAGESFEELFKTYNEDLGMLEDEAGYVFAANTYMPKVFVDAVADLEIGEVSDIVETDYGYHIIKRLDASEVYESFIAAPSVTFADETSTGRDEIATIVDNQRRMNIIEGWKQDADIKTNNAVLESIQVVKTVSQEENSEE